MIVGVIAPLPSDAGGSVEVGADVGLAVGGIDMIGEVVGIVCGAVGIDIGGWAPCIGGRDCMPPPPPGCTIGMGCITPPWFCR